MKYAKVSSVYEGKLEEDEEEEAGRSRMARQNARARMRNFKRVTFRDSRPLRRRRKRVATSSMASSNPSASSSAGELLKENKDEEGQNQNPDMNYNNCNYYKVNKEEQGVVKNNEKFNIDVEMEMEMEVESQSEATVENLEEEKEHDNKKVGERVLIDVVEDDIKERHGTQVEAAGGGGSGGCGEWEENKWANYDGIDDWALQWSYEEEWLWMGRGLGLGLGLSNPQWEYVSGVGWIDKRGSEI